MFKIKSPTAAVLAPQVLTRIVLYSLRELLIGPPQIQLQLPASPSRSAATTTVSPSSAADAGQASF